MTDSIIVDFAIKGRMVKAVIYVRDGIALLKCNDPSVAKEIYSEERRHNPNVSWDDKMQGMIEKFPHQSKGQIMVKIQQELKRMKK